MGVDMASTVISSKLPDGSRVELTLEEVGEDGATIVIKTWSKAAPAGSKPSKTDLVELYKVRRPKGQDKLTCLAKAPGPDPVVTCSLMAGAGPSARSVRLQVEGTLFKMGDRDETYAISDAQYQSGLAFLKAADFPLK